MRMTLSSPTIARYATPMIVLHWLLALLILATLGVGIFVLEDMPNDAPAKLGVLKFHMIGGAVIGLLTAIRVLLRVTVRRPPAVTTGVALMDLVAALVHWGLYVLVLAMVASGIATAVQADLPTLLSSVPTGRLPTSFTQYPARMAHSAIAAILLLTIALHLLAAVYHQWIRRDGLLSRMWFSRE